MSVLVVLILLLLLIGIVAANVARDVTGVLLIVLLVLTPLHNWPYLPGEMMGFQGLSLYNIVWLMTMASLLSRLVIGRESSRLEHFLTGPLLAFALAYAFCILWALMDIDAYPKEGRVAITRKSLVLESVIKPLQLLCVAWAVFAYSKLSNSTKIATAGILLSAACFSLVVFAEYTSAVAFRSISASTMYLGRDALSDGVGIHANSVGAMSLYSLVFAALVHPTGRIFVFLRYAAIAATLLAIVLSFSRAAWGATLIVGAMLFFRLSGKERITLLVIGSILAIFLAGAIIERTLYGTDAGDASKISAGRIEKIWVPLLTEVVEHPLIGSGKYAVLKSEAYENRAWGYMTVTDPHSSYMEVLLDMGFAGALILFGLFAHMYRRAARLGHPLKYQIWALALVGLTGHSFYPYLGNHLIWVTYGLLAAQPLIHEKSDSDPDGSTSGWKKVRLAG